MNAMLEFSGAYYCQDIEWKLIYVGSAESESYDQELDTCMVGPVPVGVNSFEFEVSFCNRSSIIACIACRHGWTTLCGVITYLHETLSLRPQCSYRMPTAS